MTPENKTRFQTIVCALIAADQIYPTGIISEFHAEYECTEEAKRRIVMAAVSCGLAEIDSLVGNVLAFEIDHLDCATAIASCILHDFPAGHSNAGLGAELDRKVRNRIFMEFETLEYMSAKELWYAFIAHTKDNPRSPWHAMYAKWLSENPTNDELNKDRDDEQAKAAQRNAA